MLTRGTIVPVVMASTSRINGMTDSTLWWEENGINQCTTRLCAHTSRTRMLIGRIHSIRRKIEYVKLAKL